MNKKLDMNKLYTSLLEGRLEECVKGTCECITQDEHQRNLELAIKRGEKELKLTIGGNNAVNI